LSSRVVFNIGSNKYRLVVVDRLMDAEPGTARGVNVLVTLAMIRHLHAQLDIPAESLIQPPIPRPRRRRAA
jgi:hypothetical protein